MGNREGVVSLKSFFSTVKGIFGFDNAEKEIDSQTEKEVAALKAESEKSVADLENNFTTREQKRQAFESGMKENIKRVENVEKPKAKNNDREDERM